MLNRGNRNIAQTKRRRILYREGTQEEGCRTEEEHDTEEKQSGAEEIEEHCTKEEK